MGNIPDNIIEDREGNIYIPEEELEYMEEPSEDNGEVTQTELGDLYGLSDNGPMEDESEEREIAPKNHDSAWWQLRQALQGLHPPQDHDPDYDEEEPQQDQELIFLPPDSMYLTREDDRDYLQPLFIPSSSILHPPPDLHQLGKRDLSSYNLRPSSPILDYAFQPVGAEYNVPDLFQHVYKTPLQNFERFDETDADSQEPSEEDDHATEDEDTEEEEDDEERDPGLNPHKRQTDSHTLMNELYNTEDADNDILYYNPDNEPIAVESVFDRRERLDVKKPGPFFTNSPNNFFLDKLVPEDFSVKQLTGEEGGGQTEYEFPLSPQSRPKKKATQTVLTIPDLEPEDDTLTIHYNRMDLEAQAQHLVQYVAQHLGLAPSAFSLASQPETSRLVLSVHANPKNLNATTMAALLNADSTLTEHARRELGITIKSFEAGNQDSVFSVATTQKASSLVLLILLISTTLAVIASAAGLFVALRRRRAKLISKVRVEKEGDKEEPVKEYKQLVRDWSRSSRASQSSVSNV